MLEGDAVQEAFLFRFRRSSSHKYSILKRSRHVMKKRCPMTEDVNQVRNPLNCAKIPTGQLRLGEMKQLWWLPRFEISKTVNTNQKSRIDCLGVQSYVSSTIGLQWFVLERSWSKNRRNHSRCGNSQFVLRCCGWWKTLFISCLLQQGLEMVWTIVIKSKTLPSCSSYRIAFDIYQTCGVYSMFNIGYTHSYEWHEMHVPVQMWLSVIHISIRIWCIYACVRVCICAWTNML